MSSFLASYLLLQHILFEFIPKANKKLKLNCNIVNSMFSTKSTNDSIFFYALPNEG